MQLDWLRWRNSGDDFQLYIWYRRRLFPQASNFVFQPFCAFRSALAHNVFDDLPQLEVQQASSVKPRLEVHSSSQGSLLAPCTRNLMFRPNNTYRFPWFLQKRIQYVLVLRDVNLYVFLIGFSISKSEWLQCSYSPASAKFIKTKRIISA